MALAVQRQKGIKKQVEANFPSLYRYPFRVVQDAEIQRPLLTTYCAVCLLFTLFK